MAESRGRISMVDRLHKPMRVYSGVSSVDFNGTYLLGSGFPASMSFPGEICGLRTSYSTSLPSSTLLLQPPTYMAETTLTDLEVLIPEPPPCEIPACDLHPCHPPPLCCHLPAAPPLVFAHFAITLHEV